MGEGTDGADLHDPATNSTAISPGTESREHALSCGTDRGVLVRGTAVGRYTILSQIGAGGLGVVYAAYDPELDRKIALKVIKPEARRLLEANSRERLLREAQALAKLQHPNVVAVHDVGTRGDEVFIAMELAQGVTVREWRATGNRSVHDILRVFAAVARGLAAAHRSGLVHRDVKPDNLLVGDDGRVRVLDFGLARAADDEEKRPNQALADTRVKAEQRLCTPLTQAGTVLGTPLYMAPEQHLGHDVDARADQFSFCVTLYEALCGQLPFAGETQKDLSLEVTQGRVRPMPGSVRLPRELKRALLRGLSVAPRDRHASMDALASVLEGCLARPQRVLFGAVAIAMFAAVAVVFGLRHAAEGRCDGVESLLDGSWDDTTRNTLRSALLQVVPAKGDAIARDAIREFDAYSADWVLTRTQVCRDTHVRALVSERDYSERTRCLDDRLTTLRTLLAAFQQTADREKAFALPGQATQLLSPESCVRAQALAHPRNVVYSVTSPAIDRVRTLIAKARGLRLAGDYAGAGRLAAQALATRGAGVVDDVRAQAQFEWGMALNELDDPKATEAHVRAAAAEAARAGDNRLLAQALIELGKVVGYDEGHHAEADELLWAAELAISQAGGESSLLALLHRARGAHYFAKGELSHAIEAFQRSLAVPFLDDQLRAGLLNNLGYALLEAGRLEEARSPLEEALTLWEKHNPHDPLIASPLNLLAQVDQFGGRYEEAERRAKRAFGLRVDIFGEEHSLVSNGYSVLGMLALAQGDLDRADELLRRCEAISKRTRRPDHPETRTATLDVGRMTLLRGDAAGALPLCSISRSEFTPPQIATASVCRTRALLALHRPAEALAESESGCKAVESQLDANDFQHRLECRFMHGEALWEANRDLAVGLAEAREAYAGLSGRVHMDFDMRSDMRSWLAARGVQVSAPAEQRLTARAMPQTASIEH